MNDDDPTAPGPERTAAPIAAHFGAPEASYESWEYAGDAASALDRPDAQVDVWLAGVRALDDDGLARPVGPAALFLEAPIAELVLYIDHELIHHLSEVCATSTCTPIRPRAPPRGLAATPNRSRPGPRPRPRQHPRPPHHRSTPMSRTVQITFDAHDPRALSTFWRDLLGYVHPFPPGVEPEPGADPLAAWDDFLERTGVPKERRNSSSALEDPEGTGPRLFFQQVPEDKVAKNRVHLDVRAAPGLSGDERMAALETECERVVALGATRLKRFEPDPPLSLGFIVMQDPEGNEFCLD